MMHQPIVAPALGGWCILRTSPGRTLGLAASLAEAGLTVWTPKQTEKRRRPRSKMTYERDAPILPTFVFAAAAHLSELEGILRLPLSPHPAFSIFRYHGDAPIVSDGEIAGIRRAEEVAARRAAKGQRHTFTLGTKVRTDEGGFAGMSGVVEESDGKFAVVGFGGNFRVKIAAFLLRTDAVQDAPSLPAHQLAPAALAA